MIGTWVIRSNQLSYSMKLLSILKQNERRGSTSASSQKPMHVDTHITQVHAYSSHLTIDSTRNRDHRFSINTIISNAPPGDQVLPRGMRLDSRKGRTSTYGLPFRAPWQVYQWSAASTYCSSCETRNVDSVQVNSRIGRVAPAGRLPMRTCLVNLVTRHRLPNNPKQPGHSLPLPMFVPRSTTTPSARRRVGARVRPPSVIRWRRAFDANNVRWNRLPSPREQRSFIIFPEFEQCGYRLLRWRSSTNAPRRRRPRRCPDVGMSTTLRLSSTPSLLRQGARRRRSWKLASPPMSFISVGDRR
jgi:hypothetical protein